MLKAGWPFLFVINDGQWFYTVKNYQMQDNRSNMKPINYVSKSDDNEILDKINRNMSHWDKEHNIKTY